MRINCQHGFLTFDEIGPGEISNFISQFGLTIVRTDEYYTVDFLKTAPSHSILGKSYLNLPAIASYAGKPWEVMRANGFVYDYITDQLVPISSVTRRFGTFLTNNYYVSTGLILPGSITDDGQHVTDYAAWFSPDTMQFKYTEIKYG